jgi:hypothetical protein
MWKQFLEPVIFPTKDINLLVDLSEGFTGSDIQDVCIRLHRRRITSQVPPTLHDALLALQNLGMGEGEGRRFLSALIDKEPEQIAKMLRTRNPKLYSHAAIARLLGVSKTTVIRWTKEGAMTNG